MVCVCVCLFVCVFVHGVLVCVFVDCVSVFVHGVHAECGKDLFFLFSKQVK